MNLGSRTISFCGRSDSRRSGAATAATGSAGLTNALFGNAAFSKPAVAGEEGRGCAGATGAAGVSLGGGDEGDCAVATAADTNHSTRGQRFMARAENSNLRR